METIIIFLYAFFTGCIYTSWLWDADDRLGIRLMNILFGFINGWYITPILIGRALTKIYDNK